MSKWLKFQVLLDLDEMGQLMDCLKEAAPDLSIFLVSGIVEKGSASIAQADFVALYAQYISQLKSGNIPDAALFKAPFSSILTATPDVLYAHDVGNGRYLIKALKPVIQLQAHHFFHSLMDGKYHPMVLSDESISWGLQISYPQIFQDPRDAHFSKVVVSEEFPNTALFVQLTKWLRRNSLPTPLVYKGVKTNVPIRIGKQCRHWIANHPQLIKRDLEVCFGN